MYKRKHMKKYIVIVLFSLLYGCVTLAETDRNSIYGKWVKIQQPPTIKSPYKNIPKECTVSMEIKSDNTILFQSGESLSNALYSGQRRGSGYLIKLRNSKSNGKRNCQGLSDEHVKKHFNPYMYFERKGEYLRYYPRMDYRNEYLQFKKQS